MKHGFQYQLLRGTSPLTLSHFCLQLSVLLWPQQWIRSVCKSLEIVVTQDEVLVDDNQTSLEFVELVCDPWLSYCTFLYHKIESQTCILSGSLIYFLGFGLGKQWGYLQKLEHWENEGSYTLNMEKRKIKIVPRIN